MARWLLRWLPFLLIVLLIGIVFLAAPGQAKVPEALDVTPEPYPFSDRYPAEVISARPGIWTSWWSWSSTLKRCGLPTARGPFPATAPRSSH